MPKTATIEDVLHFWFEEITPEHWFKKDDAFDDSIRTRFEPTIVAAPVSYTHLTLPTKRIV